MNHNHLLIFAALLSTGAQGASLSGSNTTPLQWGNAGSTTITSGEVTEFPSPISFTGVDANEIITDVSVTLPFGTGHTFADDLEITLEFGAVVIDLLIDAGGNDNIAGPITFAAGNAVIPDLGSNGLDLPITGTFDVSIFDTRATTAPGTTDSGLDAFDGLSPNGTWNLHVFDDATGSTGSFAGWSIDITTETVPEPSSILLLSGAGLLALRRRR